MNITLDQRFNVCDILDRDRYRARLARERARKDYRKAPADDIEAKEVARLRYEMASAKVDAADAIYKEYLQTAMDLKLQAICDYIANIIAKSITSWDDEMMLDHRGVGPVKYALDENGDFAGTTKYVEVKDRNGKVYRITVEEV